MLAIVPYSSRACHSIEPTWLRAVLAQAMIFRDGLNYLLLLLFGLNSIYEYAYVKYTSNSIFLKPNTFIFRESEVFCIVVL